MCALETLLLLTVKFALALVSGNKRDLLENLTQSAD